MEGLTFNRGSASPPHKAEQMKEGGCGFCEAKQYSVLDSPVRANRVCRMSGPVNDMESSVMIGIVLVLFLGCSLFAGCSSETVILRHSQTGATVTCGPYSHYGYFGGDYKRSMPQCITEYQRQGFERIPN
jgi:hypothetical protein